MGGGGEAEREVPPPDRSLRGDIHPVGGVAIVISNLLLLSLPTMPTLQVDYVFLVS